MSTLLSIIGIALAFCMIKFREKLGDIMGEAEWMRKVGGVYNIIIILAIIIFFFSVASLTGTTDVFFLPLKMVLPGMGDEPMINTF